MKNFKYILVLIAAAFIGCQEDDQEFGTVVAPTNLEVSVVVADDNSGNVAVTPTAEGVLNYHVVFSQGEDPVVISNGGTANFRYTQSGSYSQDITVIAYGRGGVSSSKIVTVDLDVILMISPEVLNMIAGDGTKRWVWDSGNAGHFGVGDPAEFFPNFFSAAPGQLNPCLYDDVIEFSYDADNNYTFKLETADATFVNWAEVKRFFPDATPNEFEDECRDINNQLALETSFVIIEDGERLDLTVPNSTMSYWSGAMTYQITELTDSKLVVRGLQDPFDPPGAQLAWYHTFVPEDGSTPPPPTCDSGATGATGNGDNTTLIWSDEFDVDGLPCNGNWSYDLANGNAGWGNGEQQYYTDRAENAKVEGGFLKITAKREMFAGSEFTSARIRTQDKFDFKFGRVEVRAKLPTGGGTWPAIWMLGADLATNPWPGAGEIDIMEHVGNQQDRIFSTLHFPGNSGGDGIGSSTVVNGVSDEFHIYGVEWSETDIRFSVDGTVFYVFPNDPSFPFDKEFFLIMNVAMGGNFGGTIDPNFTESTLEVDYIRVFQ